MTSLYDHRPIIASSALPDAKMFGWLADIDYTSRAVITPGIAQTYELTVAKAENARAAAFVRSCLKTAKQSYCPDELSSYLLIQETPGAEQSYRGVTIKEPRIACGIYVESAVELAGRLAAREFRVTGIGQAHIEAFRAYGEQAQSELAHLQAPDS